MRFTCHQTCIYPGPRGFLSPRRDETREREKRREKTSGSERYHAMIAVNQHHEIDIKGSCPGQGVIHLSINSARDKSP